MTSAAVIDPYEPRPTFLQRNADAVAATVVFVLTVFLTVISFPPFKTPEFAYVMLTPGIFWAYTRPRFKLFAGTLLGAQAVAWILLLGWLHNVTWVGLFLLGPFVGAWVGSWYLVAWWTLPRMPGKPTPTRLIAMLGLAGAWVLIEWTRTWLLGGFPWLPLSASQWTMVSMLQVAAYTGASGISFVIVAVNLGFGAYAHRLFREGAKGLNKRSQEFFLALFLVLACFSIHVQSAFNRAHFTAPFARVAFVQPYIPQNQKWDAARESEIRDVLLDRTLAAAATKPDLIVWPEAATPWAVRGDDNIKAFVEALARRAAAPLLLGSIGFEHRGTPAEKWFNGAFVVMPSGGLQSAYYAKRQLVPFGEFVPLRPLLGWIRKFVPIGDDFTPGESAAPLLVPLRDATVAVAPLICYEDIYPSLARRSAYADAGLLVVVTNNGWFGEGGAAYQHAAHSVLRAVENRRPVLRCGNGGWSGWIDEFGAVRGVLTRDPSGKIDTRPGLEDGTIYFRGTATIEVKRDARWVGRNSFYTQHGEWFLVVCAGLALFALALLKTAEVPASIAAGTAPR
ncbi:MAG TPA: apolipoprotein N-acyltransferase [Opitutaceae bacterium]|nr:apolipoprotein N-acyltransferase [Opitutaceae bacterium]